MHGLGRCTQPIETKTARDLTEKVEGGTASGSADQGGQENRKKPRGKQQLTKDASGRLIFPPCDLKDDNNFYKQDWIVRFDTDGYQILDRDGKPYEQLDLQQWIAKTDYVRDAMKYAYIQYNFRDNYENGNAEVKRACENEAERLIPKFSSIKGTSFPLSDGPVQTMTFNDKMTKTAIGKYFSPVLGFTGNENLLRLQIYEWSTSPTSLNNLEFAKDRYISCLLYTSPSPRDS